MATRTTKGKAPRITAKRMQAISIELTEDQKRAIQDFWNKTGSVGAVEIQVEVVNDRISPASIQVGTAK